MKTKRVTALGCVFLLGLIGFINCDKWQGVVEPDNSSLEGSNATTFAGGPNKSIAPDPASTHWEVEQEIYWKDGGVVGIVDGCVLYVAAGSMIPTQNAQIVGELDQIVPCSEWPTGALVVHFEPSGLQFNPPALLELSYAKFDLSEKDVIHLNWWDPAISKWVTVSNWNDTGGTYKWDRNKKKVRFNIYHFSIYSFSKD